MADIQQESRLCGKCSTRCIEGSLACAMCRTWFHKRCVNLVDEKFKYIITADKDLLWLCEVCRKQSWHFCLCGGNRSDSGHVCQNVQDANNMLHIRRTDERTDTAIENGLNIPSFQTDDFREQVDTNIGVLQSAEQNSDCKLNTGKSRDVLSKPSNETADNILQLEEFETVKISLYGVEQEGCKTDPDHLETVIKSEFRENNDRNKTSLETTECSFPDSEDFRTERICNNNFSAVKPVKCNKTRKRLVSSGSRLKQYDCTICHERFIGSKNMRKHMNEIHSIKNLYECSGCGRRFESSTKRRYHFNIHLPLNERKIFECEVCRKRFQTHQSLTCHVNTVCNDALKRYTCDICGRSYKSKSALKKHGDIHTGNASYPCEECDKSFKLFAERIRHVEKEHRERPICQHCGKSFINNGSLKLHIAGVHNGERKHLCDTCGEKFGSIASLKEHKRLHTGERPYVCEVCGKDFVSRHGMSSHKKKHGERTYECDQCDKKFKLMHTLTVHKLIHSGEKPYGCDKCGKRFMWFTSFSIHRKSKKSCSGGK